MKKIYFLVITVTVLILFFSSYFCWRIYWQKSAPNAPVVFFEIKEGQGLGEIIKGLKREKLSDSGWLLKWYLRRQGLDTKIQTGFFEVKPGLSVAALARLLTNPESVERLLTFVEGWNLRDYGHYLEIQGLFKAAEWQGLALKNFATDFDFLADKPAYATLEGYLFPDTYRFKKNTTAAELARRLLQNFGRKLSPELQAEIKGQGRTIFETITMASLIEAEARTEKDRRLVSDILWRRFNIGMPLQVDSSVNYVTGVKKPAISSAEQQIDSPYNTYKYAGLPLGPINNPGLSSILAAIYPEKNDEWFFLADKDGQMHYAKNLKEHNENKIKYLK